MNDVASLLLVSLGRTTLWLAVAALATAIVLRLVRPAWPAAHRLAWLIVLLVGWSFIRLPLAVPWYAAPSPEPAATVELAASEFVLDREPPVVEIAPTLVEPSDEIVSTRPVATTTGPVIQPPVATKKIDWPLVLLGAWACGGAALVAAWCVGYWLFVRSLATRLPADEVHQAEWHELLAAAGIWREIPLSLTENMGPLLCRLPRGFEIIVPESLWRELSPRERTAILRHELAHYQRGDVWTSLVARVLALPHWFNPAAWWAARQFDEAAEWACDRAAAGDDSTTDYASALVRLGQVGPRATFYGTAARGRSLAARIRRVLAGPSTEDSLMKKASLIAIVLGLAAASVVQIDLVAQQPAGEEKQPTDKDQSADKVAKDQPVGDEKSGPSEKEEDSDGSKGPTVEPYLRLLQSKATPTEGAAAQGKPKSTVYQAAVEKLEKMVVEAGAAYKANLAEFDAENATMDSVYDWSVRWMRAAQFRAPNDQLNAAATREHLIRMLDLQKKIASLYKVDPRGGDEAKVRAANFYVAEAERWLAEAEVRVNAKVGQSEPPPLNKALDVRAKIAELKGEVAQTFIDLQKINRILDAVNKAKPGTFTTSQMAQWKTDADKLDVRLATLTEQLQIYEKMLQLAGKTPEERVAIIEARQLMDLKIAMAEIEKEISQTEIDLKLANESLTSKPLSATEQSRLRADAEKAKLQHSYLAKRLSLYQEKAKLIDTQLRDRPDARAATDGKTAGREPTHGEAKTAGPNVRYEGKDFESWAEELRNDLSTRRRAEAIQALAAFGARGYGPQAAALILDAAIPAWINTRHRWESPWAISVRTAFQEIPASDTLPLLVKHLKSEKAEERLFALIVLPDTPQTRHETAKLVVPMLKDPSAEVRQLAASHLLAAELTPPELVAALREWLASDDPAQVSFAAGAAFGTGPNRTSASPKNLKLLDELLPDMLRAMERPEPYGPLVERGLGERLEYNALTHLYETIESTKTELGPRGQEFLEKRLGKKVEKK